MLLLHRQRHALPKWRWCRAAALFSTSPPTGGSKKDDGAPPPPVGASANSPSILRHERVDASTRGLGQVIFLNSIDSGRVILGSLALGDPTLAAFAALGTVTATSTAQAIGLDKSAWKDGLWGYNGALVGCAASAFGPSYLPWVALSTIAGAAATPVISASLKSAMSIPQWTFSFNIVALTSLLRTKPLLKGANGEGEEIATISTGFADVALAPLHGISQIFVVDSAVTGAGILGGIYLYSPQLAAHALGGSITGSLVGIMLGADLSQVGMGLWGYNSCLTSLAVGTFYVHSRQTMVLSASGAAATGALFGAMQTLFGDYGAPCLTLPFCFVASACYLLDGHIPGLTLAAEPHSPEKNAPK
ncbi:hypothetical protein ACHAXT_011676 [Thalassiosira profunda]